MSYPVGCVTRKVREGETGNPSRGWPGPRETRREGGLSRYAPLTRFVVETPMVGNKLPTLRVQIMGAMP